MSYRPSPTVFKNWNLSQSVNQITVDQFKAIKSWMHANHPCMSRSIPNKLKSTLNNIVIRALSVLNIVKVCFRFHLHIEFCKKKLSVVLSICYTYLSYERNLYLALHLNKTTTLNNKRLLLNYLLKPSSPLLISSVFYHLVSYERTPFARILSIIWSENANLTTTTPVCLLCAVLWIDREAANFEAIRLFHLPLI